MFPPHVYSKDFLQEYLLARAVAEGTNPYLPIPTLAGRYLGELPVVLFPHPTPHPPPVGLLFLPLALLDYPSAAVVWLGFELLCLVAAAYLLSRQAAASPYLRVVLVVIVIALGWYPWSRNWRKAN